MEDVEDPIQPKEEHIMGSYVLYVLQFCDHVQLRYDSSSLKPNAE